jgi:hypothetical protein
VRSRQTLSRISQYSPSQDLIKRPISTYEFPESLLLKSPKRELNSPYSTIISSKIQRSATPNLSPMSPKYFYFPKTEKSPTAKKLTIGFIQRKKENLRYNSQPLEESESYKNLNGVSTPPEEEAPIQRSVSPFSEIIDEQIKNYIDSQAHRVGKLFLGQRSNFMDDSTNYSTNDSRKKKVGKGKRKISSRSPKSVSIMDKICYGKMFKLRSRKYK